MAIQIGRRREFVMRFDRPWEGDGCDCFSAAHDDINDGSAARPFHSGLLQAKPGLEEMKEAGDGDRAVPGFFHTGGDIPPRQWTRRPHDALNAVLRKSDHL